jgi:glutamate/tyrosine decarboxylase-like PLP-dependent enzyme
VSTGAVDPLPELRALCDESGIWLHVDGAYGAFAAAADSAPPDLRGLASADSVALDPHKWLYTPLEVGCTLVRDPEALLAAFSYRPEYYHFDGDARNYFERGIQNSRGFRALKVWLALRHAGRAGYRRMIDEDIALARRFHDIAAGHPELEAFTTGLSITTYRYVPSDLAQRPTDEDVSAYLNELNEQVQGRMEKGGRAFVSNAVLDGTYVLRMCIVNFRTTLEDVEALADITAEIGRAADEELRPNALRA